MVSPVALNSLCHRTSNRSTPPSTVRAEWAATLGIALLADALFGEPASHFHPVVWIGKAVSRLEQHAPHGRVAALGYGGVLAIALPAGVALLAATVVCAAATLPLPIRVLALGIALKPAFAIRGLLDAGRVLERDLLAGELTVAREHARALVSRDTAALDAELLAAAAIESLAENLTDSIVSPLLAAALFGLPGAYAYRCINTLDSMIGYRGAYEWLGKLSARLDDAVNYAQGRTAALLLLAVAPLSAAAPRRGWAVARRDHRRTSSPNAGWTMAAAAGALGVRLCKQEHYVLNEDGRAPTAADVARARRLVRDASIGAVALAGGLGSLASWRRVRAI